MEVHMENSCLEGESNVLVLPAKKRNKRKGINQENEEIQKKKNPKLSKSQERKLKKLEQEKEKAFLLAKSIETLEKYKIPDDAFSLLRSTRDISRVETVKDKRRMAVQFSKAGLEVSHSDKSSKMCVDGASYETEVEWKSISMNENDHLQPPVTETELDASDSLVLSQELGSGKQLNLNNGYVCGLSAEEVPSQGKSKENSIAALGGNTDVLRCCSQSHFTSPIVVHVVRPNDVEEKRKDLPIVMMEQEIMEAINGHSAVIICGETGCGKTTQVPQFLYEAGFGSNQSAARGGIIGVTQPRRVAVLATARRVAYELGLHLGKEVGFQVRHDKRVGNNCRIKFMTDGILLREAQNDFLLKRYSVIILDEAHERSVNTDILIGMLSRAIPLRQKIYEDQQQLLLSGQSINSGNLVFPLKVVLMSATMRVEDFVSGRLFHNPPVIEVPTRQFPVTVHFSKRTEIVDYIGQAYEKVLSIHKRLPQGGILVFVTGQREVEFLCKKLRVVSIGALRVLPLYAMLPAAAQLQVFEGVKEGERLVVVATNVAETSLTIPGIKYVVDTGREKVKSYNPSNGMGIYEIKWISKASAAQRAGRAGRTGPGHCFRLYSSAVFNNIFLDFSCAEISKVPVDSIVLVLKSMSIDKVANFPFPTPPNSFALMEAEKCLKTLQALDDNGRLTSLGKAMAYFPMSPRHSRMLLTVIQIMRKVKFYARANLVLGYAVAAAAALSMTNPFMVAFLGSHDNSCGLERDSVTDSLGNEKNLDKQEKLRRKKLKEMGKLSRAKFCNPTSDALTTAYALQCFELSNNPVEFCSENALHLKTMEEMSKLRKQLLQLVFNHSCDQEFSWTHGTVWDVEQAWRVPFSKNPLLLNEEELLGQAICAGWADRVAKRIRGDSKSSEGDRKVNSVRYEASGVKETVFLHRWSSISNSAPEFLVYTELLHARRPYIHGATSVKSEWLVKYARSLCTVSTVEDPKPFYDPQADQVYCWVSPTFTPCLWQLPLYSVPVSNNVERVRVFAYCLLEGHVLPCIRSVRNFMAARPIIILDRETVGGSRVGNLLFKLESKSIDSCALLREVWKENPNELHSEILHWFKKSFHNHFGTVWSQMHVEIQLEPHKRFPEKVKKDKRKKH